MNMKDACAILAFVAVMARSVAFGSSVTGVLVEAESFDDLGGWSVDQQFMDQMGSSYLLAHGLGRPVRDARTSVALPAQGRYRLWVRTRDWVAPHGAGEFAVLIDGREVGRFGKGGSGRWEWWNGGEVRIDRPAVTVALRDRTGFEGRVDALFLTPDLEAPPPPNGTDFGWRRRLLGLPEKAPSAGDFDFCVVGGGFAGMCAAVAAAREGLKVALVQDRPVFGGNGSEECRVVPQGKWGDGPYRGNRRLMEEIRALIPRHQGPARGDNYKPDSAAWDRWLRAEPTLTVLPSQRCVAADVKDGRIARVLIRDIRTGAERSIEAKFFADCTGDAALAEQAGAETMWQPRHGKGGLGSSTWWAASNLTAEVAFPELPWACRVEKDSDALVPDEMRQDVVDSGGWNWETGFYRDPVKEGEEIRDTMFRGIWGWWAYAKNRSPRKAGYAKMEIYQMGYILGKRDAHRIVGDYVLTEEDVVKHKVYPDGVVDMTWYIDLHAPCGEFRTWGSDAVVQIDSYPIPFRCLYSRDVANLLMAGKAISGSYRALASFRVQNTTAQMGSVVGKAVSLCVKRGWTPRELGREHFDALDGLLRGAEEWKVAPVNGAPGLLRNGKPVSPVLFWQRELEERDVKDMHAAGVDMFSMFYSGAHDENPYWREDGTLDMSWPDRYISRFLSWTDDSVCLPRIFYTPPRWWCRRHPEECVVFAEKYASDKIGLRASFASDVVFGDGVSWYRRAISHLEKTFGGRTMGYHLACGPWGEHFHWDAWAQSDGPGRTPPPGGDMSEPMRRAFSTYVREKYGTVERLRSAWKDDEVTFETVAVPTMTERRKVNADGWRDPAEGRKVPDYFECHNRIVPDMIAAYAKVVKEATAGRKISLAFYGYTQDEPWAIECDHRAPSRAYAIRDLDAFSAPHTYHRRRIGEDGLPRQYLASAALHGKLFFDEGDDLTFLERQKAKPDDRAYASDLADSLSFLYREFGNAVTFGTGLWYMDLTRGTFRHPEFVKTVGRMRAWGEKSLAYSRAHMSEVAVISNPESEFYMDYRTRSPAFRLYREQIASFCRAGAPWDWYLVDDLDAVAKRRDVKVVAFLDCEYMTDEQVADVERMRKSGKRIVFFHAPGYVSPTGLCPHRFPETSELMTERLLSSGELRAIYRQAGVHVYTEDDVVLSANRNWIMVHADRKRVCKVRLPRTARRVYDIVTERTVSERADEFSVDLGELRIAVLLVEYDGETP